MNVLAASATCFSSRAAVFFTALLCGSCAGAFAQAASTDYTNDLPSVQRVETQIQGTDPTDTIARQVAVFEYLQVYIQRIKLTRDYKGPYSPAEQKLLTDYAKAQYDLTQSFTKTHTPQEVSAFSQKEGQYSINNALGWIKQLEGSQAADAYKGAEASLSAAQQRNNARIQADLSSTTPSGGGAGGGENLDPSQKRCLELGGSYNECAGAMMGLIKGLGSLLTLGASDSSENEPPPLSGVILVGAYHSRTDLPEIALTWDGHVSLSKCGTLVDATHTYTLRKSGATTEIVADNEPNPIVLTLRPDGSLAGPGNISVKGSIITGYHNQYTCTNSTPYTNGNCTTSSTPIYSPSMQRCTISQLAPQPAPPPPPKPTGFAAMADDMFGAGNSVATIYGFRVIGPYASSSNMQLSFNNGYVTLDCGKAHVNVPYTVDNTAGGFVIHVQNGAGPFLLGVAPDNTLRGSGSATVNGRLVSAVNGQNVSFTPHSESCNVGTLSPKGKQNTMLASDAPMAAVPSYSAPAPAPARASPATAPVSPAATSPAAAPSPIEASLAGAGISASGNARAQFRVLLSSTFTGANPLAGQTVFVSRKPMDQILRELGVAVPANATPAQAMQALQTLCHSSQGCSSAIKGLSSYYVTTTKLDSTGKATLSATAATGPYYFFAIVPNGSGSTVWDVLANLAAGDNAVSFTPANGEQIR